MEKQTKPAAKKPAAKRTQAQAPKLPAAQVIAPKDDGLVVVPIEDARLKDLCIAYVQGSESNEVTANQVARAVAEKYLTPEAFDSAKKAFQALFILPGLSVEQRNAYTQDIPDRRTEVGKNPMFDPMRAAKQSVQKILSVYFSRIKERAFPPAEQVKTSLRTATAEMLAKFIKKHEKAINGNPTVIKALKLAEAANLTTVEEDGSIK